MSSLELELIFDGPGVESGKIDAGVLGASLTACSEVFRRANDLTNGEDSRGIVLVESQFKGGSFDVNLELVQNLVENAKALITVHPFLSAAELGAVIGLVWSKKESLIGILKWLKGEKAQTIKQTGNNVELVAFGQKKTISNTVNIYLNDPPLRDALARLVRPLRQQGLERIKLRPKTTAEPSVETTIEKNEAPYFEPDPLQLSVSEAPNEGERDAVLTIAKLAFTEDLKWTFFEQGASVIASIEDEDFWGSVHRRKFKFAEGDRLRVRLHWRMVQKGNKIKPENTIVKVYEVLQRARQMRLDQKQDDEVV